MNMFGLSSLILLLHLYSHTLNKYHLTRGALECARHIEKLG